VKDAALASGGAKLRWSWYTDITRLQRGTGTPMATGVPVALLRRELELPYAVVRAT